VPVAQATAAALQEHHFLAVLGDITQVFTGLGIVSHCAAGHLDNLVLAILAEAFGLGAIATVGGEHMTVVLQMKQRPIVAVATQDDMTSSTAIATVGAAVGHILLSSHVRGTASALS
jgi:NAD/NADP transhydrogenase beta subunit